jgi:hypothetical protein
MIEQDAPTEEPQIWEKWLVLSGLKNMSSELKNI